MDKQTFSSWGSIVCIVLVIAIMMAFATPFSGFIADGVRDSLASFKDRTDTILGTGSGSNPGTGGNDSTRLEGDGSEFYTLAPTPLTFLSPAPSNTFKELKVNGETVDPSNYTLTEGSTTSVTLSIDYLKTLEKDTYEVTIVSEGTTATGEFKVEAPELNEYGFYYNQPYVGYVQGYGNVALFYRENGVLDFIITDNGYIETATYTVSENTITNNVSLGAIPVTISNDAEIQCDTLGTAFVLGDSSIVADGDYIYIYNEELGGYVVTAIDKTKASFNAIKTHINGYPTIKLGDMMFVYYAAGQAIHNTNLTVAPQIPDGVIVIGEYAFGACSSLNSIVIPESVAIIGDYAFVECFNLTNVTIPSSVTQIGKAAFQSSGLTSIVIPENVDSIGEYAFAHCTSMNNVTIGKGVTIIGAHAFGSCTTLTSITFEGTIAQWNAITKDADWNFSVPATYVQCSDGRVPLT